MTPFARTVCACPADVAHCRRQPGFLIPSDLLPIMDRLSREKKNLYDWLMASAGAIVGDLWTGQTFRIPTITPRRKADGSCVFLDDHERCAIHDVAPFGCAYFDDHMATDESDRRSLWGHRQIQESVTYNMTRRMLANAAGAQRKEERK